MDFELTISGLCIVALKSSDDPLAPSDVDIVCPRACHHRARLNFNIAEVERTIDPPVEPELVVDPAGGRFGSLDLTDQFLQFEFNPNPYKAFALQRGPHDAVMPPSERWLNWVPTLEEIGFESFTLDADRPQGAVARISLPKGELECRNVVRDAQTRGFARWEFPAVVSKATGEPLCRAVANEVVYRASSVGTLTIRDAEGRRLITANRPEGTLLRMSISNDLHRLTVDTPMETAVLEHLAHVESVARRIQFAAPRLTGQQRTGGGPVCSQVINEYSGG